MRKSTLLRFSVFVVILLAITSPGFAAYIFESATMGPSGQTGGLAVYPPQYSAARFHLSQQMAIDHIGGHLLGSISGGQPADSTLFGAILNIDGPGGFPIGTPTTFQPLAVSVFTAPFPSADVSVPLSVTLQPGDYAVMFGSGRFGATGSGAMPQDNFPSASTSQFFISVDDAWRNGTDLSGLRVTVSGIVVPEPSSLVLTALGFAGLAAWGWRRKG